MDPWQAFSQTNPSHVDITNSSPVFTEVSDQPVPNF